MSEYVHFLAVVCQTHLPDSLFLLVFCYDKKINEVEDVVSKYSVRFRGGGSSIKSISPGAMILVTIHGLDVLSEQCTVRLRYLEDQVFQDSSLIVRNVEDQIPQLVFRLDQSTEILSRATLGPIEETSKTPADDSYLSRKRGRVDDQERPSKSGSGSSQTKWPSDKELLEIAHRISSCWQTIGIYLGLSNDQIQRIKLSGPEAPYQMLMAWKDDKKCDDPREELRKALCREGVELSKVAEELLPVFPSNPDEKNREEIEGGLPSLASSLSSSSSMLEESEKESVEETSGKRMRIRRSPRVKRRKKQRTSTKVVHIFDDDDDGDNDEVDEENDSGFETREEKIGSKRREEGLHRPNPPKRHKVHFDQEETKKDDNRKFELKGVSSGQNPSTSGKDRAESGDWEIGEQPSTSYDQEHTDFYASQQPSTSASGRPHMKKGNPEKDELEQLADDIDPRVWKKVARKLKIDDPKITAIDKENEEFSEKKYEMLQEWKQKNGRAASWEKLYQALVDAHLRELAEKHCCEEMN